MPSPVRAKRLLVNSSVILRRGGGDAVPPSSFGHDAAAARRPRDVPPNEFVDYLSPRWLRKAVGARIFNAARGFSQRAPDVRIAPSGRAVSEEVLSKLAD